MMLYQDDDYGQSNVDDDDDDDDVGSYYEWSNHDNDYYIDVAIDYDNDDYDDDNVSVDDDDEDDKKAGYGRQLGTISWIKWTVYNHCVNGKVYTRHCTMYQPYGQNSLDRTKCRSSLSSVQCTACALIGNTQETRLTEKMSEIRRRQAELYCAVLCRISDMEVDPAGLQYCVRLRHVYCVDKTPAYVD